MTKSDLWKIYSTKYPQFNGEGQVTLSAAGLKKLFDTTWDVSHEEGEKTGKALGRLEKAKNSKLDNPFSGFGFG